VVPESHLKDAKGDGSTKDCPRVFLLAALET